MLSELDTYMYVLAAYLMNDGCCLVAVAITCLLAQP